ncbi:hypothetical protein CTI12_AA107180 [Artemisia annua]|uniref:Uncharacterized protein n=1 Tax=Artemisia annua TaxID=35608 RepID=A0A2U1PVM9_ARTAN|nr:hypothetical protein CTI12_AA107180 [Artemisia annua]
MSSAPGFQINNNTSDVDVYDAQLTPPPKIEGRKNTSELSFAENGSEVKAAPDLKGVVHDNPSGANLSYQTTSDKSAPGYPDMCPKNPSELDESANTTSDKSAPGYAGITPKNPSEESANNTTVNQKEIVGNSLDGKRFKDVNLTAYY